MTAPVEVTEADLFAEIGRLYVENKALRQMLAAPPPPPPPPPPTPPPRVD